MGSSIVATQSNFEVEVIQASYQTPVLVDFFATWCGPCQMLKPILEKLVQEHNFILAKVDIDQNPELANAYAVEGVPDVRIVQKGTMTNGFVGVLPEPKLRELLSDRLKLKSAIEVELDAIHQARQSGNTAEVQERFLNLIEQYPQNRRLLLDAAHFFRETGDLDKAEYLSSQILEHEKEFLAEAQTLKALIQFQRDVDAPILDSESDSLYIEGAKLVLQQEYEAALEHFLTLAGRDRKYRNDGARKAMISIFNLLGDDHPLTSQYRKRLMQTLY